MTDDRITSGAGDGAAMEAGGRPAGAAASVRVVRLPADLGSTARTELAGWNEALRGGRVRLDWSDVVIAPATALDALLAGLEVDRDADILGIGTVRTEALAELVLEALERAEQSASGTTQSVGVGPRGVAPGLFLDPDAMNGAGRDEDGEDPDAAFADAEP